MPGHKAPPVTDRLAPQSYSQGLARGGMGGGGGVKFERPSFGALVDIQALHETYCNRIVVAKYQAADHNFLLVCRLGCTFALLSAWKYSSFYVLSPLDKLHNTVFILFITPRIFECPIL